MFNLQCSLICFKTKVDWLELSPGEVIAKDVLAISSHIKSTERERERERGWGAHSQTK